MSIDRARSFLLMTYHDLPNILLIGSLFFGILSGYLPLTWVGLGMILNWIVIYLGQLILGILFDKNSDTLVYRNASLNCAYGYKVWSSLEKPSTFQNRIPVAPSFWMGSAFFFSIFCIYNSIRVMIRPSSEGASQEMIDNRQAYTITTTVIGIVFLGLILLRGFTGCETWFGGLTAFLLSGGLAISFWHLLDSCGGGKIPDILQVMGSIAPDASNNRVPVVCSANIEGFQNGQIAKTAEEACQIYKHLVQNFLSFSQEFSKKSPENPLHTSEFEKKNTEMARLFSDFKKTYTNKFGMGSNPNEFCITQTEKDGKSKTLYKSFQNAQKRLEKAGWKLGV